jgi:ubiquitin conjugation factor E4 B
VYLPTSKTTVDRSTIKRHLLNNPLDPFNRQPLTIEMVEPDAELQAKVLAYVEERKRITQEAKQAAL